MFVEIGYAGFAGKNSGSSSSKSLKIQFLETSSFSFVGFANIASQYDEVK